MKKIIITLLLVLLANPIGVFAQVFNQSQVILPTYGGFIVATSTTGTSKLSATTTPFFNTFNFNTATGTSATTTNLFSTTASSTSLFSSLFQGGGISACNTTTEKLIWSGGYFSCGTDFNTGGSSFNWPFDFTSGNAYVSTTTNIGFLGSKGIFTTGSSTLNTLLVNSSSTLQNFTFINATGTSATTTNFFATTASTTNLSGTAISGFGLTSCTGTNALTYTGTGFTCTAQPQGTVTSVTGTYPVQSTGGATPVISLAFGTTTANIWGTFNTFLASTTLQNFTGINATTSQATTTNLSVGTLFRSGTTDGCGTWAGGVLGSTGSACGSGGSSFAWPFDFTAGKNHVSTTTTVAFFNGLFSTASSTFSTLLLTSSSTLQNFTGVNATTTNATTTSLAVSNLVSCDTIDTTSTGSFVCGTDSSGGAGAYPFALTGNATSTLTQFNAGLTAYASSTIGAGATRTGLTIDGTATTTLNIVSLGTATSTFAGSVTVGGRIFQVGSGKNYVPSGGATPTYIILDGASSAQDTSVLYGTNGALKWELGSPGDGTFQLKKISGTEAGGYTFTPMIYVNATTSQIGFNQSVPTGFVEFASSTGTSLNAMQVTFNNTNPSGGTNGTRFVFTNTDGNNWYIGNDAGQNRGDNFYINDGAFGSGLFMNSGGTVGFNTTSITSGSQVTVNGVLDATGGIFTKSTSTSATSTDLYVSGSFKATIASTTPVNANFCTTKANLSNFAPGGAVFDSISMTNNAFQVSPISMLVGTTSEATCFYTIPPNVSASPSMTLKSYFTSTSTSANKHALDIDTYVINPSTGTWDPSPRSMVNMLAGSTTASQLLAETGTAWGAFSTTTSLTNTVSAYDVLVVRFTSWGADADNSSTADLKLPINPVLILKENELLPQ